jgi:hypothetical protein
MSYSGLLGSGIEGKMTWQGITTPNPNPDNIVVGGGDLDIYACAAYVCYQDSPFQMYFRIAGYPNGNWVYAQGQGT